MLSEHTDQMGKADSGHVGQVNAHLKRAEANLQLGEGSIGHLKSPPKGSAAKLAKMRLEQALADLEPAGKLLAQLPAGAASAEAKKRYETAVKQFNKLRGILTVISAICEARRRPRTSVST